jgi:hypothetical protein
MSKIYRRKGQILPHARVLDSYCCMLGAVEHLEPSQKYERNQERDV